MTPERAELIKELWRERPAGSLGIAKERGYVELLVFRPDLAPDLLAEPPPSAPEAEVMYERVTYVYCRSLPEKAWRVTCEGLILQVGELAWYEMN